MSVDLCKLTEDILPLYVDDLLSPETRRAVAEHARSCPACARLLAGGAAASVPVPDPGPVEPPDGGEASALRFIRRVRRLLFYGLAGLVALLIAVGSLSYAVGTHRAAGRPERPFQVADSFDLARKLVPGWDRAVAAGQVVTLGVTRPIPGTNATITFEAARYGERESYILYSVTAPEGEHVAAAMAYVRSPDGTVHWPQGHMLGGFSDRAFHQVMWITHQPLTSETKQLSLTVRRWIPLTPGTKWNDFNRTPSTGGELTVALPVPPGALAEQTQRYGLNQSATWLGRIAAPEQLEVGLREARLTVLVELPEGEADPGLVGSLAFDGEERRLRLVQREETGQPGRWRLTYRVDPPTTWPADVMLKLHGISFARTQPLVMELPWNRYRGLGDRVTLKPEERPAVAFYDSRVELAELIHDGHGFHFGIRYPSKPKPHVRFHSDGGEVSLTAPNGHVITNLGGGYGPLEGGVEWWGIWFDEADAEALQNAEVVTLRVQNPQALLVIEEDWQLALQPD